MSGQPLLLDAVTYHVAVYKLTCIYDGLSVLTVS